MSNKQNKINKILLLNVKCRPTYDHRGGATCDHGHICIHGHAIHIEHRNHKCEKDSERNLRYL